METFDESLKYLLHEEPADFLRFGFDDPDLAILGPCETGLPSRGRDVDGSYFVVRDGEKIVAHVEFHRRHQALDELAIDVAEAQIRLYRRERCPVVSHVWDLYGDRAGPRMKARKFRVGPGTQSAYIRINLRAMKWRQLLGQAPPALWPLVPLTRDGATEIAVKEARDAITRQEGQNSGRLADHLAVLWFVAEAENVPADVIKSYIKRAELMESALYKSIFAEGEARAYARTICRVLDRWLGSVEPTLRQRIASFPNPNLVVEWHDAALELHDVESARALLDAILQTPIPPPARGSSQAA
jgi:hypothetical protein